MNEPREAAVILTKLLLQTAGTSATEIHNYAIHTRDTQKITEKPVAPGMAAHNVGYNSGCVQGRGSGERKKIK